MALDPVQLKKDLSPVPTYTDLISRLQTTLSYASVRKAYAHSMADARTFARGLLGDDPKQRYGNWLGWLQKTFATLDKAGVKDYPDLVGRLGSEAELEAFCQKTGLPSGDIIGILKFLLYWALPGKKDLNQLVLATDTEKKAKNAILKTIGVRTSLDLLDKGGSLVGRKKMAEQSGLPLDFVTEMVNRADFTRVPFSSGKTISYFMGAGYPSLTSLAKADIEQVKADMLNYGQTIGKNLKFGVEADSGVIVARVLPKMVEE